MVDRHPVDLYPRTKAVLYQDQIILSSRLFFLLKFQTPVTLCGGELWSILVVRLAHSADLRSRLRHVSSAFGYWRYNTH